MDFNCKHVRRDKTDQCPYAYYRKSKPKGRKEFHFKVTPNLKVAIIKMRKKGHSINRIAQFWGRSNSVIWKVLNTVKNHVIGYTIRGLAVFSDPKLHFDNRKLPHHLRQIMVGHKIRMMERYREAWETWVLGEGEKPP